MTEQPHQQLYNQIHELFMFICLYKYNRHFNRVYLIFKNIIKWKAGVNSKKHSWNGNKNWD